MTKRRTAIDQDAPNPDLRIPKREELMRDPIQRISSWPASQGAHFQAGHMTAIAKALSDQKVLAIGPSAYGRLSSSIEEEPCLLTQKGPLSVATI